MQVVCNEPVARLQAMRSVRLWNEVLNPDLPGKILLVQAQLNHGISGEEKPLLDTQLLALYKAMFQKFAQLHGEATRCFLVRAPESLVLLGNEIAPFGGPVCGFAYRETAFCVSPRSDSKVSITHVDDKFPPLEFDLAALPKARVLDWPKFIESKKCAHWAMAVEGTLLYYVNRHKGPTGQVELPIPGVNIVAGSVLPPGETQHCQTTLTAAALCAIMSLSGEWGKIPLHELTEWCREADILGNGRRCNAALAMFGMAGETLHVAGNPARPKGHALAAGTSFVVAHTGAAAPHDNATQQAAAELGLLIFRERLAETLQSCATETALPQDEQYYTLLQGIPLRANRAETLALLKTAPAKKRAQEIVAGTPEPTGGYALRGCTLFVLSELQRASRAAEAIRKGDTARLGHYLALSQLADASTYNELSPAGQVDGSRPMQHAVSDVDLESLAEHSDPLWRQTGAWCGGTAETDLLCDLAQSVAGVHGARRVDSGRIVVMCTREAIVPVLERLTAGYYAPRGLAPTLAGQIFPSRGVGVIEA